MRLVTFLIGLSLFLASKSWAGCNYYPANSGPLPREAQYIPDNWKEVLSYSAGSYGRGAIYAELDRSDSIEKVHILYGMNERPYQVREAGVSRPRNCYFKKFTHNKSSLRRRSWLSIVDHEYWSNNRNDPGQVIRRHYNREQGEWQYLHRHQGRVVAFNPENLLREGDQKGSIRLRFLSTVEISIISPNSWKNPSGDIYDYISLNAVPHSGNLLVRIFNESARRWVDGISHMVARVRRKGGVIQGDAVVGLAQLVFQGLRRQGNRLRRQSILVANLRH